MIILTTISREWDRRIEKTGTSCSCRSFVVPFFDFSPSRYHDLGTSRRNGLKDGSKNSKAMLVTKIEEETRKKRRECRVRASIFVKARVIYLIYNDERRELVFFFFVSLSMYIITIGTVVEFASQVRVWKRKIRSKNPFSCNSLYFSHRSFQ